MDIRKERDRDKPTNRKGTKKLLFNFYQNEKSNLKHFLKCTIIFFNLPEIQPLVVI